MRVRLQRFLADAGVASRRAGEQLILAGRVAVNGQAASQLGTRVDADRDAVTLDGARLKPRRKLYVALHKPRGYLCTRKDPGRRPIVADLLPAEWRGLYPVGRLDGESEGLIFLTNDGDFCLRLTHPRYGVRKRYVATVEGRLEPAVLGRLRTGIQDRGERLQALAARMLSTNRSQTQVELVLAEGRNREVRRLFEALGRRVLRLQRTQIGPIRLAELPVGKWRTLTEAEIESLLREL
jgi:23S rRNA pseudouridine2605 synthase